MSFFGLSTTIRPTQTSSGLINGFVDDKNVDHGDYKHHYHRYSFGGLHETHWKIPMKKQFYVKAINRFLMKDTVAKYVI